MKEEQKRNIYWQKNEDRQSIEKEEQDKPLNNKASKQTLIFRPFKGLSTVQAAKLSLVCLLYTSTSPRDRQKCRKPSSA